MDEQQQIITARATVGATLRVPRAEAEQVPDYLKRRRVRAQLFRAAYGDALAVLPNLREQIDLLQQFAHRGSASADQAFAVRDCAIAIRRHLDDLEQRMTPQGEVSDEPFPGPVPPSRWQEQWKERGRRRAQARQEREGGDDGR